MGGVLGAGMSGVNIERGPDGTVVIEATAKTGVVRLRVTREYARRVAARLVAASMEAEAADPGGPIMDALRNALKGRP